MTQCDASHATCLCDVAVVGATPIANINFLTDSFHAKRIARHLGLSFPLTDKDILDFFEFQASVKDRLEQAHRVNIPSKTFPDGRLNPRVASAKVTPEIRRFIARMVREEQPTGLIRKEVERIWGVAISGPYMSALRRRVLVTD